MGSIRQRVSIVIEIAPDPLIAALFSGTTMRITDTDATGVSVREGVGPLHAPKHHRTETVVALAPLPPPGIRSVRVQLSNDNLPRILLFAKREAQRARASRGTGSAMILPALAKRETQTDVRTRLASARATWSKLPPSESRERQQQTGTGPRPNAPNQISPDSAGKVEIVIASILGEVNNQ